MRWDRLVAAGAVLVGWLAVAGWGDDVAATGPARRIVRTDPVEWTVPDRIPVLHRGIDEATYAARKGEDLAKIDRKSMEDATIPVGGLLISEVDKTGEATKRHIKVGDIITKINGETAVEEKYQAACWDSDGFKLTIWSPATGEREEQFPQGLIGVTFKHFIDMPREYWRDGRHDERWDDDMLVAGMEYKQHPRIAQAALAHAQAAGCMDPLLNVMAALVAYEEDRLEEALRFGEPVAAQMPLEVRAELAWDLWHASIALGHLAVTQQVVKENGECFSKQQISVEDAISQFLEKYRALPEESRVSGEPFAEMEQCKTRAIDTLEHEPYVPGIDPNSIINDTGFNAALVKAWNKGHVWHYTAPAEWFAQSDFGPPLANCEATVEFTCRIHEVNGRLDYGSIIEVGLLDYSEGEKKGQRLGSVATTPDGYIQTTWENVFGMWKAREAGALPPAANGKHVIRVAVLGQRIEASIDGHVMLNSVLSQTEKERHIEGFVSITGIAGAVTGVTWKEIQRGAGEQMP